MIQKKSVGTGEHLCETDFEIRVLLNNTRIVECDAIAFSDLLCEKFGYDYIRWNFSNRKTQVRWGTAWPEERRVTLYRHSVSVFIHELAHMTVPPGVHHGIEFARRMDEIIKIWFEINNMEVIHA